MLQIAGLEKAFDGRPVLRGIDLDVAAAESVALVGANGSGKTTTLRAIAGLTIPERGRIVVAGIEAIRHPREARARMSYMAQKAAFPDTLTVRETLGVVAKLRRLDPRRVDIELADCGLEEAADRRVSTLSGGQRQRVALAAALLPDVALYLFDEPSANLDAAAAETLARRVARLRAEGRAVLFTTHVVADVDVLGTRVQHLDEGRCSEAAAQAEYVSTFAARPAPAWIDARRLWRPIAGAGAGTAGPR
ncbi:MAG: ABC transporter ATP-binding protein [Acidobacteria bacterium]|nr:ABC transporter ATP-binding protein [Acidobacteriota bacterium]